MKCIGDNDVYYYSYFMNKIVILQHLLINWIYVDILPMYDYITEVNMGKQIGAKNIVHGPCTARYASPDGIHKYSQWS